MRPPPFSKRTSWDRSDNALARQIGQARAAGRALVDLTESNPTRTGFSSPALCALLGDPRGAAYDPAPLGLPEAREAVARYYADRSLDVPAARVCLSASTSEAYGWLFKLLCERGDEVLVPAPSYPLLAYLASLEDVALVPYPLARAEAFRIDLAALEAALTPRSRAIVLVHPNNPTGTFARRDEAGALAALAQGRGLALVVDEVFGDYALGPLPPDRRPSFAGEAQALTFVLSGLSKVAALPQVKLGWVAVSGPDEAVAEAIGRLEVIADAYLSVSTPVQRALPEILARRGPAQAAVRARTAANLAALDEAITAAGALAPVRRLPLDGGWYATLEVPRTRSDDAWVEVLMREDGVIVHPGYFFDFDGEGFLVVSLLPEPAAFREAIGKVVRRVAEDFYCRRQTGAALAPMRSPGRRPAVQQCRAMPHEDLLGRLVTLRVRRFGSPGALLAIDDDARPDAPTILLPGAEVPEGAREGDPIEVFVYLDSEDRPIATTRTSPKLTLGCVAFLAVTDVTRFGAFVDWGLPKELLVPHAEQTRDVRAGERHPVGLYVDDTGRLAGTMRVAEMLRDLGEFTLDEWVEGEAWRKDPDIGVFVIVEKRFVGLVPAGEPVALGRGEAARFRVANILDDGKIELSLRGHAHEEVDKDAQRILARLAQPGTPRVGDRSSPEQIRAIFGLSKKTFKRAVGKLLKERAVTLDDQGFLLRQRRG